MREKQRASLVAYLMAKLGLRDTYDLYQYYLIDVEMSPCMMTSRLKLAISSVQLFVQRLLMNLESWRLFPGNATNCKAQWPQLKNYRVWEANRKVFLYPENWIEPDLRKSKTALFKDLESALLQGELTDALAESAFRGYLEKLDQVAQLEICGMFHEKETSKPYGHGHVTVDVLHVFGRTRSSPHIYYYRRRIDQVWTPWEKIDAAIDGNHLIPVVFNRRLYLFWPIFVPRTETVSVESEKKTKEKEWQFWDVQLGFSEYRQGMWSANKILERKLTIDPPPEPKEVDEKEENKEENIYRQRKSEEHFTFKTSIDYEELRILCAVRSAEGENKSINYNYTYVGAFFFMKDERVEVRQKVNEGNTETIEMPFKPNFYYKGMMVSRLKDYEDEPLEIKINKNEKEKLSLKKVPADVSLIFSHQLPQPELLDSFFYQDGDRTFFVSLDAKKEYRFENFYHPGASEFIKHLNRNGIQGLLRRPEQEKHYETLLFWLVSYEKQFFVDKNKDNIKRIFFQEHKESLKKHKLSVLDEPKVTINDEKSNGSDLQSPESREPLLSSSSSFSLLDPSQAGTNSSQVAIMEKETDKPLRCEIKFQDQGNSGKESWECFVREEEGGLRVFQNFEQQYKTDLGDKAPTGEIDFSPYGAYSQYNWELFFHAPLLLADRLSKNQRFEEAQKWFHYIFDPTDISEHQSPQRYWKVMPFFNEATEKNPIINLIELLHYEEDDGKDDDQKWKDKKKELETQVILWQKDPFDPHVIAGLRIGAYQKTVVMKYIDNLIAWADQLFRQDTIETINEATLLYILAAAILGKRPLNIPSPVDVQPHTFEELKDKLDDFHDALVSIEGALPDTEVASSSSSGESPVPQHSLKVPYFCVPGNDYLTSYWDTVADRLFKIRHCKNIEGIERQLPLYEPPIEPGLLVRAAAAGVDIASVLRDINAPLPYYRFKVMLLRAIDFCNDVKTLGAAFLSTLEKKDAEGLERLLMNQRSSELQRSIKEKLIEEEKLKVADLEEEKAKVEAQKEKIEADIDGWKLAKMGVDLATSAFSATKSGRGAYKEIKGARKGKFEEKKRSKTEKWEESVYGLENMAETKVIKLPEAGLILANTMYGLAGSSTAIPTIITGGAGISSPVSLIMSGGDKLKDKWEATAKGFETVHQIAQVTFATKEFVEECNRHKKEAEQKEKDAQKEIKRLDKQIEAAKIRVEIAELEKKRFEKEVENAEQVDAYMRNRFTNQELYNWQVSQLSTLYFQTYNMAYDLAKRAEKACQYELGQTDTAYISFGYWDSLKKGLLAGEQLYFDLKRMEKAYLEQNKRGYEITKHVSLATMCPYELIELKGKGECVLDLPEAAFDLDYPGHYMRRIKSVSLTVKCEAKPFTNINCTLTLLKNSVRMNSTLLNSSYERSEKGDDSRFRDEVGAIQSIVTSSGQDDSGLFELNFQDDRYLPFEGAGAISQWRIELPQECNQIDVETISDLVLHIKYMARDGGDTLKEKAKDAVVKKLSEQGLLRLFSAKDEFPDEWDKFLSDGESPSSHVLEINLSKKLFPPMFRGKQIILNTAHLFLEWQNSADGTAGDSLDFTFENVEGKFDIQGSPVPGYPYAYIDNLPRSLEKWCINFKEKIKNIKNIIILINYKIE